MNQPVFKFQPTMLPSDAAIPQSQGFSLQDSRSAAMYPSLISRQLPQQPNQDEELNNQPQLTGVKPLEGYFVSAEEEYKFDQAEFDAPVPEYFRNQMASEDVAETPSSLNSDGGSRKYQESFKVKYKTEMCKNWQTTGHCEFESSCSFAHGMDELKAKTDIPKNYKTKLCKRFHKQMYCPYGARCQFLHGELQQQSDKTVVLADQVVTEQPAKKSGKSKVTKRQSAQ